MQILKNKLELNADAASCGKRSKIFIFQWQKMKSKTEKRKILIGSTGS